MFPSKDTVKLFIDISSRDGLAKTIASILDQQSNANYAPTLSYLKSVLRILDEDKSDLCAESYATGFLSCFHLFRLQLESEDMDIDDLQINVEHLSNYIKFLEEENIRIRDGKHTDTDTGMQSMPTV